MALTNQEVRILLQAIDQISPVVKQVQGSMGGLSATHQKAMGAMATSAQAPAKALQGLSAAASAPVKAIGGLTNALGSIGLAGMGIQAVTGAAQGLGSALGVGLASEVEQIQASFNAFTKDQGKTAEIMDMVRDRAAKTPFALNEMSRATASLLPVAKSSGAAIVDLVKEAEILAASNPLEGLEGASFSLREAMTGDFTSIIERFNLSRSTINKLKAEGVPNLEIVRRAMAEMGFDSDLVAKKAETLSGRWSTFLDTLDQFKLAIATPIFDALKEGLVSAQGFIEENMEAFQRFTALIVGGFSSGIAAGKQALLDLQPAFRIVQDAVGTVVQVFQGDWGAEDSIQPVVRLIGELATVVRDVVLPNLQSLGTIVRQVFRGDLAGAFTELQAMVQRTTAVLGPLLAQWGQAFLSWIGPLIPPLLAQLATLAGQLVGWLVGQVPVILAQLQLWAQQFIAWIQPLIPPFLVELGLLGQQLFAWLQQQIPLLLTQLALWGQQFVAWVAPQIPPLLAELLKLGTQLLAWIGEQVPLLVAQLLTWGQEFVAWVGPQIGPLVAELAILAGRVLTWIGEQGPHFIASLLVWGLAFIGWVAKDVLPKLPGELNKISQGIADWIRTNGPTIAEKAVELGSQIIAGVVRGIQTAQIRISDAMRQAALDALEGAKRALGLGGGGGDGGGGATGVGATGRNALYINVAAQRYAVPPAVLAALQEVEGSGDRARSPAGAMGPMQVMPFNFRPGEDPWDLQTNFDAAARLMASNYQRTGDWTRAAGAYFGYGTDVGGMTTGVYQQRFQTALAKHQGAGAGGMRSELVTPEMVELIKQYTEGTQGATAAVEQLAPVHQQAAGSVDVLAQAAQVVAAEEARWAEQQALLQTLLSAQTPITQSASAALQTMASAVAPLFQAVDAGALSTDELAIRLVKLASSSGLATDPLAQLQAGNISLSQAINQVIAAAALVDPAFASIITPVSVSTDAAQNMTDAVFSSTTGLLNMLGVAAQTPAGLEPAAAAIGTVGEAALAAGEQAQSWQEQMIAVLQAILEAVEQISEKITELLAEMQQDIGKSLDKSADDFGDWASSATKAARKVEAAFDMDLGAGQQSVLEDVFGSGVPSFQGGGVMPHTGLAYLHAGERVLTPTQQQTASSRTGGGERFDYRLMAREIAAVLGDNRATYVLQNPTQPLIDELERQQSKRAQRRRMGW